MRLEPVMWDALREAARREGMTVNALVSQLAERSPHTLTSEVRAFIAGYYWAAATEAGHSAAGHGLGLPVTVDRLMTGPGPSTTLSVESLASV
ncbi:putative DNA-binding ribbon-helix-helix protein [Azospirillum melinis]|nr:putative DNA-binding ribbon-helix-helix protein [Azospirillum melinis]